MKTQNTERKLPITVEEAYAMTGAKKVDFSNVQEDLFEIFKMGVDYGQLLMEQERDGEDMFDAFQGFIADQKYCAPTAPAPRRLPHSDEWRMAKKRSFDRFMEIVIAARTGG